MGPVAAIWCVRATKPCALAFREGNEHMEEVLAASPFRAGQQLSSKLAREARIGEPHHPRL